MAQTDIFRLDDRVALVAGGGGSIDEATAEAFAGVNETGRKHRADTELFSDLARISLLALVSCDHGRGPHHERADARELSYHCISERELVKARTRIVAEISEAEDREALLFLIRDSCERCFVNAWLGRRGMGR